MCLMHFENDHMFPDPCPTSNRARIRERVGLEPNDLADRLRA